MKSAQQIQSTSPCAWFEGRPRLPEGSHIFFVLSALLLAGLLGACHTDRDQTVKLLLERGRTEYQQQRFADAEREFRRVIQLRPKDPEGHYRLGMALHQLQRNDQAMSELYQAHVLHPDYSDALLQLAQLMVRSSDLQNVQWSGDYARRILTKNTDPRSHAEAFYILGLGQLRVNDVNAARPYFDQALLQDPNHIGALSLIALQEADRGNVRAGEERLRAALDRVPTSVPLTAALAEFCRMAGNASEAESLWRRVLVLDPKNTTARVNLIDVLSSAGHRQEAEEVAHSLVQIGGSPYRPWHALLLIRNGQLPEATQELQQIQQATPQDPMAQLRLSAALLAQDRYSDAAVLLNHALADGSKSVDLLLLRAQILVNEQRLPDATSLVERAMRLDAASGRPHFLAARIADLQGKQSRSDYELGEAIRLEPTFLPARIALARRSIANHNSDSALVILEASSQVQRSSYPVLTQMAWALLASEDWSEASKAVEGIFTLEQSPEIVAQLRLLQAAGQPAVAPRVRSVDLPLVSTSSPPTSEVSLLKYANPSKEEIRAAAVRLGSQPAWESYGSTWVMLPKGLLRSALDPERLLPLHSFGRWEPMIDEP